MPSAERHDGATGSCGAANPNKVQDDGMRLIGLVFLAWVGFAAAGASQTADPGRANDTVTALGRDGQAAPIADGVAPVGASNTQRDPGTGLIDVLIAPDAGMADRPIVDPEATDAAAGALRRMQANGTAAGLSGVLYDNRDSGHSVLSRQRFPQVAHTVYDEAMRRQGLHHGVAGRVRFPLPVVGNSSTALTAGPLARSLGRLALADQAAALRSYRLFVSNHLYVYPEHRDYDPDTGDRLLANVPYFLLSQGSSRSDRPFVRTALEIIAALPPAAREAAESTGRLAATVQAVMRRTMQGVNSDAHYLSPVAHPPVFAGAKLRPALAVNYANSLTPDTLPPLVTLTVERDFSAQPGVDYLAANLGEILFTTPMAVARAWRSFAYAREITLRAAISPAGTGNVAPRFHWVLLQGDPERVRIRPRDAAGDVVDIDIEWHDRFAIGQGRDMATPRVDIGVIADSGGAKSAPAVFSILFPVHQARRYDVGADETPVLRSLSYVRPDAPDDYADPLVWPAARWNDVLLRDGDGNLTGIARNFDDGTAVTLSRVASGWRTDSGNIVRHVGRASGQGVLELATEP
jgi:hypothetical protein